MIVTRHCEQRQFFFGCATCIRESVHSHFGFAENKVYYKLKGGPRNMFPGAALIVR